MKISRRKIITATAVSPLAIGATSLPFLADAEATQFPDPIIDLYEDWNDARIAITRHIEQNPYITTDEELDRLSKTITQNSKQIGAMTATSLEGLACQIHLAWAELGLGFVENNEYTSKKINLNLSFDPKLVLLKSLFDGSKNLIPV